MKCVTVLMACPPRRAAPFCSLYFSIIAKLQGFGGVDEIGPSGDRIIGPSEKTLKGDWDGPMTRWSDDPISSRPRANVMRSSKRYH
jgi:hypothetical protein